MSETQILMAVFEFCIFFLGIISWNGATFLKFFNGGSRGGFNFQWRHHIGCICFDGGGGFKKIHGIGGGHPMTPLCGTLLEEIKTYSVFM